MLANRLTATSLVALISLAARPASPLDCSDHTETLNLTLMQTTVDGAPAPTGARIGLAAQLIAYERSFLLSNLGAGERRALRVDTCPAAAPNAGAGCAESDLECYFPGIGCMRCGATAWMPVSCATGK